MSSSWHFPASKRQSQFFCFDLFCIVGQQIMIFKRLMHALKRKTSKRTEDWCSISNSNGCNIRDTGEQIVVNCKWRFIWRTRAVRGKQAECRKCSTLKLIVDCKLEQCWGFCIRSSKIFKNSCRQTRTIRGIVSFSSFYITYKEYRKTDSARRRNWLSGSSSPEHEMWRKIGTDNESLWKLQATIS